MLLVSSLDILFRSIGRIAGIVTVQNPLQSQLEGA